MQKRSHARGSCSCGASVIGALLYGAACSAAGGETFGDRAAPAEPPSVAAVENEAVRDVGGLTFDDLDAAADFDGCVGISSAAEVTGTVIQLVVDTSGSMNDPAPGLSLGSKWEATRRALLEAIAPLPAQTAVGVVFYPDTAGGGQPGQPGSNGAPGGSSPGGLTASEFCFDREADVPIARLEAPASTQRKFIERAFQEQTPNGGTPTHDAYLFGVELLKASPMLGNRVAIVITDGIPTYALGCNGNADDLVDASPLVDEAARSLAAGVRTFVIGSPASEDARASLSRMAIAGGTAQPDCDPSGPSYCHFDMTTEPDFATALTAALGQIADSVSTCSYDIPEPTGGALLDLDKVNVTMRTGHERDQPIARYTGQGCTEGWQYSPDGRQIVLCPSTCARARSIDVNVSIMFGCATQIR